MFTGSPAIVTWTSGTSPWAKPWTARPIKANAPAAAGAWTNSSTRLPGTTSWLSTDRTAGGGCRRARSGEAHRRSLGRRRPQGRGRSSRSRRRSPAPALHLARAQRCARTNHAVHREARIAHAGHELVAVHRWCHDELGALLLDPLEDQHLICGRGDLRHLVECPGDDDRSSHATEHLVGHGAVAVRVVPVRDLPSGRPGSGPRSPARRRGRRPGTRCRCCRSDRRADRESAGSCARAQRTCRSSGPCRCPCLGPDHWRASCWWVWAWGRRRGTTWASDPAGPARMSGPKWKRRWPEGRRPPRWRLWPVRLWPTSVRSAGRGRRPVPVLVPHSNSNSNASSSPLKRPGSPSRTRRGRWPRWSPGRLPASFGGWGPAPWRADVLVEGSYPLRYRSAWNAPGALRSAWRCRFLGLAWCVTRGCPSGIWMVHWPRWSSWWWREHRAPDSPTTCFHHRSNGWRGAPRTSPGAGRNRGWRSRSHGCRVRGAAKAGRCGRCMPQVQRPRSGVEPTAEWVRSRRWARPPPAAERPLSGSVAGGPGVTNTSVYRLGQYLTLKEQVSSWTSDLNIAKQFNKGPSKRKELISCIIEHFPKKNEVILNLPALYKEIFFHQAFENSRKNNTKYIRKYWSDEAEIIIQELSQVLVQEIFSLGGYIATPDQIATLIDDAEFAWLGLTVELVTEDFKKKGYKVGDPWWLY